MRQSAEAFERLVADALDELPEWVREHMSNVALVVMPWPTPAQLQSVDMGHTLLGLYEGVPLTRRGRGYYLVAPDRISLFQGPLEAFAATDDALVALIQRTIVHEIAHHFGFSEEHIRSLGY